MNPEFLGENPSIFYFVKSILNRRYDMEIVL